MSVSDIEPWAIDTMKNMKNHPETWPVEKEIPIPGEEYCVCLRIREEYIHGEPTWLLDAVTYRRENALIEMYMNMAEGTRDKLIEFMEKQLIDNCAKFQSYCISMCRRLDEKDEDDFFEDFW